MTPFKPCLEVQRSGDEANNTMPCSPPLLSLRKDDSLGERPYLLASLTRDVKGIFLCSHRPVGSLIGSSISKVNH